MGQRELFSEKSEIFLLFPLTRKFRTFIYPGLQVCQVSAKATLKGSMFAVCSQYVRSMFAVCSQYVRNMFAVCSQYVRSMFEKKGLINSASVQCSTYLYD